MKEKKSDSKKIKGGRKPIKDPAIYRYGIKLNSKENDKFKLLLGQSEITEYSKYIKSVIFGTTLKVVKIDKATKDYYIRLTNFYHQYQAIGNNYNQTVRAIQNNFGEKRAYHMLLQLEKATLELVKVSKEIIDLTREYEEKWLER